MIDEPTMKLIYSGSEVFMLAENSLIGDEDWSIREDNRLEGMRDGCDDVVDYEEEEDTR